MWLAQVMNEHVLGKEFVGTNVALKQFPKVKGMPIDSTAITEIETGSTLFPLEVKDGFDGDNDDEFERGYAFEPSSYPGMKSIAKMINLIEDKSDLWIIYEVGSKCLSKHLHDVKGEFYRGERIYNIVH